MAENFDFTQHFAAVMRTMTTQGLMLGTYDPAGKANLMTIGWGTLGSIWGMPLWSVLVRPSRYTYSCIEQAGCFTVCVPTPAMKPACTLCGTQSGKDLDKIAACKFTAARARLVNAPDIAQCPIVYQCEVIHNNDVIPSRLAGEILGGAYKSGDYHRIYFGRILDIRIDPDAAARLA
jgi:flavin reductase (DIM6/NTAB) family NADH-FMN oxidoreductase RutF